MRFTADGPSIPDELLVSRDAGDVIFFCGAGVSQAKAHLPNFEGLGREVIRLLGAAQDSPARRLLDKALEMGRMASVGGLLATDRIFGLLEREFEIADVRAAIAEAIKPVAGCGLDAHRIMLDLATSRAGVTRIVTTNFDLLFEECDSSLACSGPPQLPDPRNDRDFRGIVHLHGRVDPLYRGPQDDEFVVSSADFGRAYLTDGWATKFIQSLLARFQIVFVGYTADDPPVQYLLEALNLRAGTKSRLFAFQEGESGAAAALWEHKGVQAIPFNSANGFGPLWDTLAAWAARARDVDGWYAGLLSKASGGPAALDAHVRGQIAHIVSTREGARRMATIAEPLDATWLLSFDPRHRFGIANRTDPYNEASDFFDPFKALGLDFDIPPEPSDPTDTFQQRTLFDKRTAPDDAWDAFASNRLDRETSDQTMGSLRGLASGAAAPLAPRLASLGVWIRRVAHQPAALWWASHQTALHPDIKQQIESALLRDSQRFPAGIRRGWQLLLAAWADERGDPDTLIYEVETCVQHEGWSRSMVRRLSALYRPRLTVRHALGERHPLLWGDGKIPEAVIHADVEYPCPHESFKIPDEQLAYAVSQFRGNLELAISLEEEVSGNDQLYFETTRADDADADLSDDSYGLTGPIIHFQKLMDQWALHDPSAWSAEVMRWPADDRYVFARLRIWAASKASLSPVEAANIFLGLPDVVFWGSLHGRDLLYALRDRWAELQLGSKSELEHRLRTTSYPYDADVRGGRDRAVARDRLDRLHWLSGHGLKFSFDLAAEMAMLAIAAPDWTTQHGDQAAASHAPVVFSVGTDDNPTALLATPIHEILSQAEGAGQIDFVDHVQREPFLGLAASRPVRALAALTHAARRGEAPRWAWSEFLRAERRLSDSARMIAVIARRLERLPINRLYEIAYPVSGWMECIAERLYGDSEGALEDLWNRIIEALASGEQPLRQPSGSWAGEALNAPVGKLFNLLMKDPRKNGLAAGAGYPPHWTTRLFQLLSLPGNLRRQALVMTSFQLAWLFYIDPAWTERQLMPLANDTGYDGDAFWEGFFWWAKIPPRDLLLRLKPSLLQRAVEPRRGRDNIIAGLLLAGWGGSADAEEPERLVTDIELREVLIHTDDDLRGRMIWQLGQWLKGDNGRWRGRVIPFLEHVWPKQRALRTPSVSAKLVDFALASGDLLPEIVKFILPRLVPVRGFALSALSLKKDSPDYPPRKHPRATLDLLWAVLAEDSKLWPYRIEAVLAQLAQAPETIADARLAELRRRRER